MDTRRDDEPAWTTHARRITPGDIIRINRDDDAEEGDMGLRSRVDSTLEKRNGIADAEDGSGGSSSSQTAAQREEGDGLQMRERRRRVSPSLNSEEAREEEEEAEEGERQIQSGESGGRETPPLAQYREGNHLIIERRRNDSDEVGQRTNVSLIAGRCRGHPESFLREAFGANDFHASS